MWRIAGFLIVVISGIACDRPPQGEAGLPPGDGVVVVDPDGAAGRPQHPPEHPLRAVPVLIGLPSEEMGDEVRKGKALLGGCVWPTDQPPQAVVCERCRLWKTDEMKDWQPLPEAFGELEPNNGG